jgi:hypothetical protein
LNGGFNNGDGAIIVGRCFHSLPIALMYTRSLLSTVCLGSETRFYRRFKL